VQCPRPGPVVGVRPAAAGTHRRKANRRPGIANRSSSPAKDSTSAACGGWPASTISIT
jgi:hypothetical protein